MCCTNEWLCYIYAQEVSLIVLFSLSTFVLILPTCSVSERDVETVSLIISQFFCVRLSVFALYLDAASVQEGSHSGSVVKNPPAMQETQEMWVHSLGWKGPLEEEMATHSSILVWRIPWTEEPGGLQSMELQRVGHD